MAPLLLYHIIYWYFQLLLSSFQQMPHCSAPISVGASFRFWKFSSSDLVHHFDHRIIQMILMVLLTLLQICRHVSNLISRDCYQILVLCLSSCQKCLSFILNVVPLQMLYFCLLLYAFVATLQLHDFECIVGCWIIPSSCIEFLPMSWCTSKHINSL